MTTARISGPAATATPAWSSEVEPGSVHDITQLIRVGYRVTVEPAA